MPKRSKSVKVEKTGQAKSRINQNMLIAIIGAAATIFAALLPSMIDAFKPEPAPTVTTIPPTHVPTSTHLPPTATLTPTPEPPTATPTTPIGIYDVYLALDAAGETKTTSFTPSQTIYAFFRLNDPSGLNHVKAALYAVDVKGFKPNVVISQNEETIGKQSVSIQIKKDPYWAPGKYKLELYLNEILLVTQEFEVQE